MNASTTAGGHKEHGGSNHPSRDEGLFNLLTALRRAGYAFTTPTPATQTRVLKRLDKRRARDLRDVFGWNLPFDPALLTNDMLDALKAARGAQDTPNGPRSRFRVSTLRDLYFLHSAFPTDDADAVFFGPDSYRFADLIERELTKNPALPPGPIVDIGAGAGVGALTAQRVAPGRRVILTDVNPEALRLARVNAKFANAPVETVISGDLSRVEGDIALALANPPYIDDPGMRTYRDGGAMHGGELSVTMACMAARRLAPGGRLILYTGAAIVDGRNRLCAALRDALETEGCTLTCRELDPDVFGEELDQPAYRDVERIAVIAATAVKDRA